MADPFDSAETTLTETDAGTVATCPCDWRAGPMPRRQAADELAKHMRAEHPDKSS